MKSKSKIIILITIGILLLSPIIDNSFNSNVGNSENSTDSIVDFNFDNKNPKTSEVLGKILIDNNWTAAKVAGICTGNGTYSEPYVIDDLVVDAEGSGSCIWIKNSSAYFKIENCTVYNSGSSDAGIKLQEVNNGLLINNIIYNNRYGIKLESSYNNRILGNTANSNKLLGISLSHSNNNTISGNSANNNGDLIPPHVSGNLLLADIPEYDGGGIFLSHSINNTVAGNIANNQFIGIKLHSERNAILGNYVCKNEWGIALYSDNNTFSGNIVNDNGVGIYVLCCEYNTITGNIVNNNGYGIYFVWSNYSTILNNTINFNVSTGIRLSSSYSNIILDNYLIGNMKCIVEDYCEGENVIDNNFCCNLFEIIFGYVLFFLFGIFTVVAIPISKKLKRN